MLKIKQIITNVLLILMSYAFLGCSDSAEEQRQITSLSEPGTGTQEGTQASFLPKICSTLSFDGVTWPVDYRQSDQVAFSLAMNVTGSFEGHAGWTNLSNNFDGQGVSMGILNQNLGQGTLQPLLIKMRDKHRGVLEKALSSSMLKSLEGMLSRWERSRLSKGLSLSFIPSPNLIERKPIEASAIEGDVDKRYAVVEMQTRSNSSSVRWAKKTLYTDSKGRKFKSAWKKAFKQIIADPAYVSLQIEAARYIHDRAHRYRHRLGWEQLRSYLFLFDIVVQNGSLKDKHFERFEDWFVKENRATEEEQMLKMLEIRVVDSHPKWQKDVRIRKTTTIKGTGFVHGEERNLPVEYCYDPVLSYLSPEGAEVVDRL